MKPLMHRSVDEASGSGPAASQPERAERLLREFHVEQEAPKPVDLTLLARLWPFMRPHKRLLFSAMGLIPLIATASLAQPYLTKRTVDAVLLGGGTGVWAQMVGLYALSLLVEFAARFVQVYTLQLSGQRCMVDLRRATFRRSQQLRIGYYDSTPIGRILTRVTNDVDSLGELFSSGAVMAVGDVVMVAGVVAAMLSLDWKLSLIVFAVMPPLFGLVELIRRLARGAFREIRTRIAQLNAYMSEQVQGIQVVQAFGREAHGAEEYAIINDAHRKANYRSIYYDAMLYSTVETVSMCCVALVLYYAGVNAGVIANDSGAAAYIGTVVAFYQYIQQFFVPIRDLSTKYTMIQSSLASAERVFGFLDLKDVEGEGAPAEPGPAPEMAPDAPAVQFDDVHFGYRRGDEILHGINLTVGKGERIAIVGHTGAGKTTTISLMLRLYELTSGRILVGGEDITEQDLAELRRYFAVVQQDVFLFRGSVADNVALSSRPDTARVRDCLQRVGALDLIERRRGGIDAEVRERGLNFSAGERQLIAFARALYSDAPILVLDEATANIDSETEARLQQAVRTLLEGRTAIVIAHRLSTIRSADRILVFHKGRIAEQGTHGELLELGEIYSRLHKLQFGDM